MKIEFNYFDPRISLITEAARGKDHKQQTQQQQNSPGRGQFFQDCPDEFLRGIKKVMAAGALRSYRREPARADDHQSRVRVVECAVDRHRVVLAWANRGHVLEYALGT